MKTNLTHGLARKLTPFFTLLWHRETQRLESRKPLRIKPVVFMDQAFRPAIRSKPDPGRAGAGTNATESLGPLRGWDRRTRDWSDEPAGSSVEPTT